MEIEAFADANLFLRYFTNDVPDQADAVEALLDRCAAGKLQLVTTVMSVTEIVWTLDSYYGLSRDDRASEGDGSGRLRAGHDGDPRLL